MDLCRVVVLGRVQPRDPEPRFTPDGKPVTTFQMVSNRYRKSRDGGEPVQEAEWFRVTAFGRLAETTANMLTKGSRVYVEGRFQSREWEDNSGQKRTSLEIMANDVILLDQRQQRDEQPSDESSDLADVPF